MNNVGLDKKKYKVKLEVYKGPLNLLLHLIKKDEVDINDISIEDLTLQYNEYLNTFQELNIPLASEFIVMASNLMLIKSKSLLPRQFHQDEEEEMDDPKWNLIRQLLEYKKFKEAATSLDQKQIEHAALFPHQVEHSKTLPKLPATLEPQTVYELVDALQLVLKRFQEEREVGEVLDDQFSVADKIQYLLDLFSENTSKKFHSLFSESSKKQEVIVTFLALLELVKLRKLTFQQNRLQGEITITRSQSHA